MGLRGVTVKNMYNTKRMVVMAFCIAISIVLHMVESWLPLPLPVPGIKLGLANIVSLLVLIIFDWRDAIYVGMIRAFLASLFSGVFLGPAFFMSISGAVGSILAMAIAYRYWQRDFSLIGISVIGAVVHNVVQMIVAAIVVSSISLLWYLPYLVLFALPTGVATGMIAIYFLAKAPQELYIK